MAGIMRPGKTARDKANGKPARNQANKAERTAWMKSKTLGEPFPKHTCNGKRNRLVKRK